MNIPKEQLRQQRYAMLQKVQRERRRKKQLVSIATVGILFVSLLFSVRVSPTIANYAAKIPGLSVIVELMQDNEGIKDAIEHEYYEEIGIVQTIGEMMVTLQGAMIDEYSVMLMYDFDLPKPRANHHFYSARIYQGDKLLEAGFSYGTDDDIDGPTAHSEHKLEMTLDKPLDTSVRDFRFTLEIEDGQQQTFDIPFTLRKPIAEAKIVEPNKVLDFQGQKLYVKKIIRTPLRTQVTVEADPSNTMRIIALDDISIELSNGNKRDSIKNGHVASGSLQDGAYTFYLQSNYFYDADALTLRIGEVHALPKGEDFIEVDFTSKDVLYQPSHIQDWDITVQEHAVTTIAPLHDDHFRQHLYPAERADGTVLSSTSSTASSKDELMAEYVDYYDPYNGKAKIWINYTHHPIAENVEAAFSLND